MATDRSDKFYPSLIDPTGRLLPDATASNVKRLFEMLYEVRWNPFLFNDPELEMDGASISLSSPNTNDIANVTIDSNSIVFTSAPPGGSIINSIESYLRVNTDILVGSVPPSYALESAGFAAYVLYSLENEDTAIRLSDGVIYLFADSNSSGFIEAHDGHIVIRDDLTSASVGLAAISGNRGNSLHVISEAGASLGIVASWLVGTDLSIYFGNGTSVNNHLKLIRTSSTSTTLHLMLANDSDHGDFTARTLTTTSNVLVFDGNARIKTGIGASTDVNIRNAADSDWTELHARAAQFHGTFILIGDTGAFTGARLFHDGSGGFLLRNGNDSADTYAVGSDFVGSGVSLAGLGGGLTGSFQDGLGNTIGVTNGIITSGI